MFEKVDETLYGTLEGIKITNQSYEEHARSIFVRNLSVAVIESFKQS